MYLIDGNNLIGHTRSLSFRDVRCRQQLLDRLIPFLNRKRRKATVVFDGGAESLRKSPRIQIVFAGPDATADDRIRRMVEKRSAASDLCVVSSDNAVYGYARSCGVPALKCHEFNRLLREAEAEGADENREFQVQDVKAWLRYFGEEE